MGAAFVQKAANTGNGASVTATFGAGVGSGNLVVGTVGRVDANAIVASSIADNHGVNPVIIDSHSDAGGPVTLATFYFKNVTNGMTSVTFTSANPTLLIEIQEVSGLDTVAPLDAHNAITNAVSSVTQTTPSITTTANGDYIYASMSQTISGFDTISNTVGGSGATFTLRNKDAVTNEQADSSAVQTSAGAVNGTFTVASAQQYLVATVSFKAASSGATPTWGWQSRREDERPKLTIMAPDERPGFFRPSQIPVPTTWLPTTGADRERLPPLQRTDWAPTTFARSPNPVPTQWLPTTGQEDRPPPIKRPPDEPVGYSLPKPGTVPPPSTWLPTAGEHDHIKPIARAPDEPPGPWFVRSPNPVPAIWAPTTGQEDRPPPIKLPPDEPRQFFRPPQAAAVGIAGMAWFRPVEVYVGPAPPQGDYRPAWAPQIITQQVVKLNLPIEVTPLGALMNFGLSFRM